LEKETEPFDSVLDAWRSIWVALALTKGHDPDKAEQGHIYLCETLKEDQSLLGG